GIPFLETSAKNSLKVEDCFISLARDVMQRIGDITDTHVGNADLTKAPAQESSGCC
ncbi:Rab family gtpase, partial [Entamoeba invadens IP1]